MMFSVPGWNLSAPIATQVEKSKPRDPPEGKKSKKRRQQQQEQIDERNVGEYWEKVIEGKDVKSKGHRNDGGRVAEVHTEAPEGNLGKKRKRNGEKGGREDIKSGHVAENTTLNHTVDSEEHNISQASPKSSSKREKKKHKKDQNSDLSMHPHATNSAVQTAEALPPSALLPEPKGLTTLQKSMRAKLTSARFRHLNESLYTKPSAESLSIFVENPEMFVDYHRGFAQQVEVWPENPVDGYVATIVTRGRAKVRDPWKAKKREEQRGKKYSGPDQSHVPGKSDIKPLPCNMRGICTIADLGCGTASLSQRLQPSLRTLSLTLHSFDLSKPTGPTAPLVTVADIAALPLPDSSVDVAIFCLALMGTNWLDFIDEAWRVLRWRGELWVSEIKSRFGRVERSKAKGPVNSVGSLKKEKKAKAKKNSEKPEAEGIQGSEDEAELATRVDGVEGKEGTDVSAFVEVLRKRGFILDALPERRSDAIDLSNKMFVKMQFVKTAQPLKGKNVKREDAERGHGNGGLKMGIKGKKFAVVGNDADEDGDEGKVLKPCLYKIR